MKRIWICLLWLACLCPMYGQGLRILFIGDSITDGNWGNSDGSAMPSAGRNLWDMNHIYGSGYMYLCASYYQSKYRDTSSSTGASAAMRLPTLRSGGKKMP